MNYTGAYVTAEKKTYCPACKAEHSLYVINATYCNNEYQNQFWYCDKTKRYWDSLKYLLEISRVGYINQDAFNNLNIAGIHVEQPKKIFGLISGLKTFGIFVCVVMAVFINITVLGLFSTILKGIFTW